MAPSKAAAANAIPPYAKDEKVLCFHGEMLYEAKILDSSSGPEAGKWQFKIHYKGWKATWDDWVDQDRVMKFTEENRTRATQLQNQMKALQQKGPSKSDKNKKGSRTNASDNGSIRGSEECNTSVIAQTQRSKRAAREHDTEPEKPSHEPIPVQLPMPLRLKSMLVDDWENVTKNKLLVPVPCPKPVNVLLDDYLAQERCKREVQNAQSPRGSSAKLETLEEAVDGLREYFEKALGRILLYKFERYQYLKVLESIRAGEEGFAGKNICDIYGAEHFCRLLSTFPERIAEAGMDKASMDQLCDEIAKITLWLNQNAHVYFASNYEHPGQDYRF